MPCSQVDHPILEALHSDGSGVALIVAHPDDESIGLGGHFATMPNLTVIHLTDGAAQDEKYRMGFSQDEYRDTRAAELARVFSIGGIRYFIRFDTADLEAAFCMPESARRLALLYSVHAIRTVFTHAYEGGHPDHDATAFVVHAAAALRAKYEHKPPVIIEMPYYHLENGVSIHQKFLPTNDPGLTVKLTGLQVALKKKLYAAHETQRGVLKGFSIRTERFRLAQPNFNALANEPLHLYDAAGINGRRWLELVRTAKKELELT